MGVAVENFCFSFTICRDSNCFMLESKYSKWFH